MTLIKFNISLLCAIAFSFLFVFTSCGEEKVKVPYYRIDQSYTSTMEDDKLYFDLTTSICKVKRYSTHDYDTDKVNMYGLKITKISEDNIEKYLLDQYGKAEELVSKFEHVDQMIDKDYKGKDENIK